MNIAVYTVHIYIGGRAGEILFQGATDLFKHFSRQIIKPNLNDYYCIVCSVF